jgi:hypothetical protein
MLVVPVPVANVPPKNFQSEAYVTAEPELFAEKPLA